MSRDGDRVLPAVRDARAWGHYQLERAAYYREALIDVREMLPPNSPAARRIDAVLVEPTRHSLLRPLLRGLNRVREVANDRGDEALFTVADSALLEYEQFRSERGMLAVEQAVAS